MAKLPLRTYQELALFCSDVANMDYFAAYFLKKGQILAATSLSKDAKLITLAVSQRAEISKLNKRSTPNKGWFKNRQPNQAQPEQI